MEKKESLFNLTAEEVEFMQEALEEAKFLYLQEIKKWEGRRKMLEHKECIEKWDYLLTRIKQWQDENK